jgi:hypothetical protein
MARGLSSGQISRLNESTAVIEDLIEISLPFVGQYFYYTTGSYPVTVNTPSAGSQNFTPNSFVSDLSYITESYEFTPQPITLTFERLISGGSYDDLVNQLNTGNFINSTVTIYKLFRDPSTMVPDTTNGLFNIFTGKITNFQILYSATTTKYQLACSNGFIDDRVNGRTTADIDGALNGKKIYWGRFTL